MVHSLKKITNFLILVSMAITLFNCAGSKPGKGYVDDTPDEIQKLIRRKYKEGIHAVGTGIGPNEEIAKQKATIKARAEIARLFKTQIDALQKSYEESVNDKAVEDYSQVIEIFASLEISGSEIAKSLVRKEGRKKGFSSKVLVVVSADKVKELIDQKMQTYTSYKAAKAYKELEERVAREKKAQESDSF